MLVSGLIKSPSRHSRAIPIIPSRLMLVWTSASALRIHSVPGFHRLPLHFNACVSKAIPEY